jgi:soluble lytic murein transglycosylase-like protein
MRRLSKATRVRQKQIRHDMTAQHSISLAVFLLGLLLTTGQIARAAEPAAGPNTLTAQAIRYEHGEGVRKDLARAHALYCEAAFRGDALASLDLAWMFLNGRGVPRNDAVAVYWLRKASEKGVAQASNLRKLLQGIAASTSTGCDGETEETPTAPKAIREIVLEIAPPVGISSRLVLAVISVESAFNTRAVSRKNAKGLMQLMPSTVARFGVVDPYDARENIRAGVSYLKSLLQRFHGNLTLALAAYNAGEAAVDAYGGMPPFAETINYVERIKQIYAHRTQSP